MKKIWPEIEANQNKMHCVILGKVLYLMSLDPGVKWGAA